MGRQGGKDKLDKCAPYVSHNLMGNRPKYFLEGRHSDLKLRFY